MCLDKRKRLILKLIAEDGTRGASVAGISVRYYNTFPANPNNNAWNIHRELISHHYLEQARQGSEEYVLTRKGRLYVNAGKAIVEGAIIVVSLLTAVYGGFAMSLGIVGAILGTILLIMDLK